MHYRLRYLPEIVADWIVVIVHRTIFADFFTFRPRKGQRSWLDAHNILGVVALPFHLMITYSGLIFYAATLMPLIVAAHYGAGQEAERAFYDELNGRTAQVEPSGVAQPLTSLVPLLARAEARWGKGHARSLDIGNPGDTQARVEVRQIKSTPLLSTEALVFDGANGELLEVKPARHSTSKTVRDVFLGLHEGLFASPPLRWLYFISGLLGTAMIGTGLVLWTVKRRQRAEKQRPASLRGLAFVERLNVGTIVGLPVAIAAYFWANRLIPVSFTERAAWEVHAMFIVWAVFLLHAALRPVARAWIEQAWIAAAAFAFVPVLNALTTNRHLGVSLPQGDWVMAGFDLTMLAFGAIFVCMAVILMRRESAKPTTLQRKRTNPIPSRLMEPAE